MNNWTKLGQNVWWKGNNLEQPDIRWEDDIEMDL